MTFLLHFADHKTWKDSAFDFLFIVDNVKEKVVKKRKQLFRYNFEVKSYFSWKEVRSLRVYFIHSSVYLANNFLWISNENTYCFKKVSWHQKIKDVSCNCIFSSLFALFSIQFPFKIHNWWFVDCNCSWFKNHHTYTYTIYCYLLSVCK